MTFEKSEAMVTIPVRVSPKTRQQAQEIAAANGVSESKVYRSILEDFFSKPRQLSVDETETESNDNE